MYSISTIQLDLSASPLIVFVFFWKRHTGKTLPQPLAEATGQCRLIAPYVFSNGAVRGPASSCFADCFVAVWLTTSRVAAAPVRVRVAIHRNFATPHLDIAGVGVARVKTHVSVFSLLTVVVDDGHV